MKLAISLLLLSLCATAHSRGKEDAALRAVMFDKDQTKPGYSYRMLQNRVGDRVTSFDLEEIPPQIVCIHAPCPQQPTIRTRFHVTGKRQLDCNSFKWTGFAREKRNWKKLEVIDHTERMCDDVKEFLWEAKLQKGKRVRLLVGNPVADDIDCGKYVDGKVCTMQMMPVRCKALSYGGQPLEFPIVVDGSNPCHANIDMDFKACERGLDPERFVDGDIKCMFAPPPPIVVEVPHKCPIASCVAPPEGCIVEPDNTKDAQGCLVNPCGNLMCK